MVGMGASTVAPGQNLLITWGSQNVSGLADVYVTLDEGETWTWLGMGQASGGSLNWLTHLGPVAPARVRVFTHLYRMV